MLIVRIVTGFEHAFVMLLEYSVALLTYIKCHD